MKQLLYLGVKVSLRGRIIDKTHGRGVQFSAEKCSISRPRPGPPQAAQDVQEGYEIDWTISRADDRVRVLSIKFGIFEGRSKSILVFSFVLRKFSGNSSMIKLPQLTQLRQNFKRPNLFGAVSLAPLNETVLILIHVAKHFSEKVLFLMVPDYQL